MNEKTTEFVKSILAECGDEPSEDNLIGFEINHPVAEIELAANGDVESIVAIRTRCGLPVFS